MNTTNKPTNSTPIFLLALLVLMAVGGCGKMKGAGMTGTSSQQDAAYEAEKRAASAAGTQKATFGTGCFWCTEAIFAELNGVSGVISGYTGGQTENPSYREVCNGTTGHAEVVQISFDPTVISFEELLEVFWQTHDPTTLNRQGGDTGTQYRSAIFYHNDEQQKLAQHFKERLDKSGAFRSPIVTEITKFEKLYAAEGYHQNYNDFHSSEQYCQAVIAPKLDKFRQAFADKLKK